MRLGVIRVVCALVLSALIASCSIHHESDPVEGAIKLIDTYNGRQSALEEAKVILDAVLVKDPNNARALTQLSRYYTKSGYLNNENINNGHYLYTMPVFDQSMLGQAFAVARKATQADPKLADGHLQLGYILYVMRHTEEAKERLAIAQRLDANNPRIELLVAKVHFAEGSLESAETLCKKLEAGKYTELAVVNDTLHCLTEIAMVRGDHASVVAYYRQMAENNPHNAWVREALSDYLRSTVGDYDAAIRYAEEALQIMDYPAGHRMLAMSLYAKWADAVVNHRMPEADADAYYDRAYSIYPFAEEIMADGGSDPTGADLVRALQGRGVSIDAATGEDGSSALLIAVNTNRNEVVESLLRLGADPNVHSGSGWTPLLSAADEGNRENVHLLLEHGADRTQTMPLQDRNSMEIKPYNAAEAAERNGHPELGQYIRDFQAPTM